MPFGALHLHSVSLGPLGRVHRKWGLVYTYMYNCRLVSPVAPCNLQTSDVVTPLAVGGTPYCNVELKLPSSAFKLHWARLTCGHLGQVPRRQTADAFRNYGTCRDLQLQLQLHVFF